MHSMTYLFNEYWLTNMSLFSAVNDGDAVTVQACYGLRLCDLCFGVEAPAETNSVSQSA